MCILHFLKTVKILSYIIIDLSIETKNIFLKEMIVLLRIGNYVFELFNVK